MKKTYHAPGPVVPKWPLCGDAAGLTRVAGVTCPHCLRILKAKP